MKKVKKKKTKTKKEKGNKKITEKNTEKNKKKQRKNKKCGKTQSRKERKHTCKNQHLTILFHFFCGNLGSEFEPKHPKAKLHKKKSQ